MKIKSLANSKTYYEISNYILREDRFGYFKIFLRIVAALPFAIATKILKTLTRCAGICVCGIFLILTLGMSKALREIFVAKVSSFAADLADWVLFPFAVTICLSRLILATVVHPVLFIHS